MIKTHATVTRMPVNINADNAIFSFRLANLLYHLRLFYIINALLPRQSVFPTKKKRIVRNDKL